MENFTYGMRRFKVHLASSKTNFNSTTLVEMMDFFADEFREHLGNEPMLISSMAKYNSAMTPIDIKSIMNNAVKAQLSDRHLIVNLLPALLFNIESK
jgi:hypothetical protein